VKGLAQQAIRTSAIRPAQIVLQLVEPFGKTLRGMVDGLQSGDVHCFLLPMETVGTHQVPARHTCNPGQTLTGRLERRGASGPPSSLCHWCGEIWAPTLFPISSS
jgi:hypothetical protein